MPKAPTRTPRQSPPRATRHRATSGGRSAAMPAGARRRTSAKAAPFDAVDDTPPSKEEIAASHAIASQYYALVRQALRGLRVPARYKRSARPPRPAEPERHADCTIATIALILVDFCRRGDCRRIRRCQFGRRPGETAGDPPPCVAKLPRAARLALPLAAARRLHPEHFRDPDVQRNEDEAIRCARIALQDGQ